MRSAGLFAVLGLVFVLAVSSFSPVAALGGIDVKKVTTNGDVTTTFDFTVSVPCPPNSDPCYAPVEFNLVSGADEFVPAGSNVYTVKEVVPSGWYVTDISCQGEAKLPPALPSTFEFMPGEGVIITFVAPDYVVCTFTNSPISPAVGGAVVPANNFAIVAPWLAIVGLVGCIGTAAVIRKKRHQ